MKPARPYAILAVLTLTLALSYVDRYLLAIMVQPIKAELGLSDTQIGLLTGFAFSAFYAAVGIPLARYADRGHRRAVICGSIMVWSLVTASTAAVTNFAQLALARFGVGAGEGGVFPTAQAIIADHVPVERRTSAMAIFASGGSIGLLLAFALGGALEARLGWRMSFVVMATPALIVVPLALLVLPPDTGSGAGSDRPGQRGWAGLGALWADPHFRQLPFAQSAVVVLLFGQAQWLPAFFERTHQMPRATIGAMLGLLIGIATVAGAVIGGLIADRLRRSGEGGPIWLALFSLIAAFPLVLTLYLWAGPNAALLLVGLTSFLFAVPTGPIAAHLQFVVAPSQRALAAAAAVMIASVFGSGLGPLAIGAASDLLSDWAGAQSLRLALLATTLAAIAWALWHLSHLLSLCRSDRAAKRDAPVRHPQHQS